MRSIPRHGMLLVAYQLETPWKPKISYRYAFFEGDKPAHGEERSVRRVVHRILRLGHLVAGRDRRRVFRLEFEPDFPSAARAHEANGVHRRTGLIFYDFLLDEPASAGVTSDKVAYELDWYMDWSLNDNFVFSFVAAVARSEGSCRTVLGSYRYVLLRYDLSGLQLLTKRNGPRCEAIYFTARAMVRR